MDELLACQEGRAEDPGVVAQGGAFDANRSFGVGEGLDAHRGADQVDVRRAQRPGDAAADDDDLGAEDIDQATQSNAQEVGAPAGLP